jgi:hypothetical protein
MAPPEEKICEVCHKRLATHHVSYGGTGKSSHLCDECFQTSAPAEVRQAAAAARDARCQYCGGQPCAGGMDMFALITGAQRTKFMCMACTMEYHRYTQQEMQSFSADLPQEAQFAAIRALLDAADTHMKKWVSKRQ